MDIALGDSHRHIGPDTQCFVSWTLEWMYHRLSLYDLHLFFFFFSLPPEEPPRILTMLQYRGSGLHPLPRSSRKSTPLDRRETQPPGTTASLRLRRPEDIRSIRSSAHILSQWYRRTHESDRARMDGRFQQWWTKARALSDGLHAASCF